MRTFAPALAAAALLLGLVPGVARAQQTSGDWDAVTVDFTRDGKTGIDADKAIQVFATRLGVPLVCDPQMTGARLQLGAIEGSVSWGLMKQVLDVHDIVIEVRRQGGQRTLYAHLRRNLATRVAPPFPQIDPRDALEHKGEVVIASIPIKNGAGSDIFATVRGLLVRDINRIGNILYVRGPELIIVNDFAENVDNYYNLITQLDVPSTEVTPRVLHLERTRAAEAAAALERLYGLTTLAAPSTSGSGSASSSSSSITGSSQTIAGRRGINVVAVDRTNDLLVTALPSDMAQIEALVREIDGPASSFSGRSGEGSSRLWPLAAGLATLAFLGQTVVLRRLRRRYGYKV